MSKYHRHKQRVLTTIVTLIAVLLALDAYILMAPVLAQEANLLFAFLVAVGFLVAYQTYNYRHSHEHLTLVNTLTQIFLGSVLFLAGLVMLLLYAFWGLDITDMYLWLSIIVIVLTFLFLRRFDEFLEREVSHRFPEHRKTKVRK